MVMGLWNNSNNRRSAPAGSGMSLVAGEVAKMVKICTSKCSDKIPATPTPQINTVPLPPVAEPRRSLRAGHKSTHHAIATVSHGRNSVPASGLRCTQHESQGNEVGRKLGPTPFAPMQDAGGSTHIPLAANDWELVALKNRGRGGVASDPQTQLSVAKVTPSRMGIDKTSTVSASAPTTRGPPPPGEGAIRMGQHHCHSQCDTFGGCSECDDPHQPHDPPSRSCPGCGLVAGPRPRGGPSCLRRAPLSMWSVACLMPGFSVQCTSIWCWTYSHLPSPPTRPTAPCRGGRGGGAAPCALPPGVARPPAEVSWSDLPCSELPTGRTRRVVWVEVPSSSLTHPPEQGMTGPADCHFLACGKAVLDRVKPPRKL